MAVELLIHSGIAEQVVARVRDGRLERLWRESSLARESGAQVGDVILGRVKKLLPASDAAFVEIGEARAGFLALRDAQSPGDRKTRIGEAVREGEAVLVQLTKDAVADKGARVTTEITLPGRFVVLTPGEPKLALSRRISDENERARLTDIVQPLVAKAEDAGFVVRTAAAGISAGDLTADAEALLATWRGIRQRARTEPPALLHREAGLIARVLRDEAGTEIARVRTDDRGTAAELRTLTDVVVEEVAGDVFEQAGLADALAALDLPKLMLPSGGWILIEETETLTAIDVNSGSHPGVGLEAMAFAVNREAAEEAARQIVLRGLGGLIVVDFIRMRRNEDEAHVLELLRRGLAAGGVPFEAEFSPLGFAAVTRRRERKTLEAALREPCERCGGSGRRPGMTAIMLAILRGVERAATAAPGRPVTIHAASEIAGRLEAERENLREGLARKAAGPLRIVADPSLSRERFSVETTG